MTDEVKTLIASLTKERARIDRALAALTPLVAEVAPRATSRRTKKPRVFSAETRARMSAAQKARRDRGHGKAVAVTEPEPDGNHLGAIQ